MYHISGNTSSDFLFSNLKVSRPKFVKIFSSFLKNFKMIPNCQELNILTIFINILAFYCRLSILVLTLKKTPKKNDLDATMSMLTVFTWISSSWHQNKIKLTTHRQSSIIRLNQSNPSVKLCSDKFNLRWVRLGYFLQYKINTHRPIEIYLYKYMLKFLHRLMNIIKHHGQWDTHSSYVNI